MRAGAVVAALSLAVAGLTGLPAAGTTLEDPPVPPAEPQITATYNGTEILNCLGQQVCPEIAVAGEPVTFTITTTSPNVVKQRYTFNSNPVDVDGSNLTLSLTPTEPTLHRLDVQSFDDLGQAGAIARFLINVGPRPRPIGSWSFNDGAGTTAADTATPAHPLTLANGAAFDGKGRLTGSLALDGIDDYAESPEPVVDTSKSFTIAAWARPSNATKAGVIAAVTGSNTSAFGLYYDAAAKRWVFARSAADVKNPTLYRAVSKEAPVNGAWTHLIGSYDAATGKLQLFVNGRLQQTASSPTTAAWRATGPLAIGRAKYAGSFTGNFSGSLDQVNVWQRVLVAEEIAELVEPRIDGRTAAGVAAYWPLDNAIKGTDGVWRTAETVRGADLTIAGFGANQSGAFVDDAERGRVLAMSGRSGESVMLNRPVVDGGASFTVAVRVKLGDPDKPMVIARQGIGGKDSWRLEYKPIDMFTSQWIFARGDAGSSTETVAISTVDREFIGGWHLLAASYVGLTGQIAGPASELVLSVDGRGSDGSSPSYPGSPLRTGSTVVGTAATSGKTFTGNLDDLRLYAGVAQGSRLCEDYAGLEWCGS